MMAVTMYGDLPEIDTLDGHKIRGYPIALLNPADKTCVLRLPTTAELLTYLGSQRSLYRTIGRGGESTEVDNPKADQALFRAIRLDKGSDWDDAEALYALNTITRTLIPDCGREGNLYVISLATIFGVTTHTVSIPLQKDMA